MSEYEEIVVNILSNEEFNKLKNKVHHKGTRYDHSLKVSYFSYLTCKKLNLDYVSASRAGLLHDFFLNENKNIKEKTKSFFTHPNIALENSKKYFKLNKKEENIISSHMFPSSLNIPKYKESFIVSIVDKIVAVKDFNRYFKWKIIYKPIYTIVLIILFFE